MFDQLLEIFERDRRSGASPNGGLRNRVSSLLGIDPAEPHRSSHRDQDCPRDERVWDDDRHDGNDGRHPRRSNRREFEPFDFGD